MNTLKDSILKLSSLNNVVEIENALQNILELILRNYHMEFGKVKAFFTDIEIYYRNKGVYDDVTVHGDIKQTHFNEVYVHKHRKYKCFDICISLGDYYLSFLVRGLIINGTQYYEPSKVYDAIIETRHVGVDFDEAKDILVPNLKSEQVDDKFVMFSNRINIKNEYWSDKALRAVIDSSLKGKDKCIKNKSDLVRSLVKGMSKGNANALCKIILGEIVSDL